MDAVDPELHAEIRRGLRSGLFFENVDYLLDVCKRRAVEVMLNVPEHGKNWFELPQVFRFAEKRYDDRRWDRAVGRCTQRAA